MKKKENVKEEIFCGLLMFAAIILFLVVRQLCM